MLLDIQRGLLFCLICLGIHYSPGSLLAEDGQPKKVLYFTHEPGTYHRYTPQLAIFRELAKRAGWELTVMTGDHEAQIKKLRTSDFGKGYDAIVYNFCFARADDLEAAANLIAQTRDHGVPAMLIHCAMHSWWPTYKSGKAGSLGPEYQGQAKADPKLVRQWRLKHGERPFPVWGDFTGVASTVHGKSAPIIMQRIGKHPATRRFPEEFITENTELYNNVYQLEQVVPLVRGVQGKDDFLVMWACPQGKSEVLGLTVGHDLNDWTKEPYQNLIIDGVNYLADGHKSSRK